MQKHQMAAHFPCEAFTGGLAPQSDQRCAPQTPPLSPLPGPWLDRCVCGDVPSPLTLRVTSQWCWPVRDARTLPGLWPRLRRALAKGVLEEAGLRIAGGCGRGISIYVVVLRVETRSRGLPGGGTSEEKVRREHTAGQSTLLGVGDGCWETGEENGAGWLLCSWRSLLKTPGFPARILRLTSKSPSRHPGCIANHSFSSVCLRGAGGLLLASPGLSLPVCKSQGLSPTDCENSRN